MRPIGDVTPPDLGLRTFAAAVASFGSKPLLQWSEEQIAEKGHVDGWSDACGVQWPSDINRAVSALPRHLGNVQTVFVKLVRRMRDTHAYASDHVRPPIVFEAARYLINTPLFIQYGVTLDENWLEQEQIEPNQLQQDLDREDDGENPDDPGEHEDDAAWEDVNEEDEILADQETLLDDVDIISPDTGISIALGENRVPTSLLFDKHAEELSFPTIYCGLARNVASSVSIMQIAKAEARMLDRRCAANIAKLFLSFCRLRRHKIAAQRILALHKETPDLSFGEFLEAIGMEEEHYIAVVRPQVLQPKVFLRRDLKEIKLKSYNKLALPLNEGNMDIQFMPDPYGAAEFCYL
ncbi:Capsid protein [Frankliniella fusca]|uniref:Capsid protein n=1 Tax=Frankliniella fusca TaxID=407009 RepID=A0AAE1GTA2_9NEOP|nr:Capsid protein [Frankliniella fusca]